MSRFAKQFEKDWKRYYSEDDEEKYMQCSQCKSIIHKGVMIRDTSFPADDYDSPAELYYCKKCFKREFII